MENNPLINLANITSNLKELIHFAKNQVNNPEFTPEQKKEVENALKKHDLEGTLKSIDDAERTLKEKINGVATKQ